MLDRGLECLKRRTRARDYSDALQARVCAAARLGRAPAGRGSRPPPGPKHPSTAAAPAATLRQHRSARQRRPHVAQAQQTAAAVARAGRSLKSSRAASDRRMHAAVQPAASRHAGRWGTCVRMRRDCDQRRACAACPLDCSARCWSLSQPRRRGQAVGEVLAYSRGLAALAGEPEMPPGLGPVSVFGGRLDADGKRRDLRELYRCAPGSTAAGFAPGSAAPGSAPVFASAGSPRHAA